MNTHHILTYGLGACFTVGCLHNEAIASENEKPNVLLIIMDDMCSWVNYMGGINEVHTPNIDKLAERAVTFSNAYAPVPLCNPSRAAMLTGIPSYVTGIYHNEHAIENHPIANNSMMMPQYFRDNGYFTICAGKVFHSRPSTPVMNDMWDDMTHIDGGYGPFVVNSTLPDNLLRRWRDFEAWTGPDSDFPDVVNTQKMVDFLGENHDKPFFAAMGYYRPHNPYTAPKRYFDLYDIEKIKRPATIPNDLADIPEYAITNFIGGERDYHALLSSTGNLYEQMILAYLASVSFADDMIGRIISALEESPNANNTIIVLVGDNGFHHGEKERWGKSALWRKASHVPFLIVPVKGDESVTAGDCVRPVNLIDIYPTLIDICELPEIHNQLAGNSLLPLIHDVNAEWNHPAISNYLPGNFAIHLNEWNYIRYANGSEELYNISEDEHEFHNLAIRPEYKELLDSLAGYIDMFWDTNPDLTPVDSFYEDFSSQRWIDTLSVRGALPSLTSNNIIFPSPVMVDESGGFITDGHATYFQDPINGHHYSFRFRNINESYFQFPPVRNAGTLTINVRNANASNTRYIHLQKRQPDKVTWTTIHTFPVKANSLLATNEWEELRYDINATTTQIYRLYRADGNFIHLFKLKLTNHFEENGTGTINVKLPDVTVYNREQSIVVKNAGAASVRVFNVRGQLIYYASLSDHGQIAVGKGVYIVHINNHNGNFITKLLVN
jgi:arylsulfatase A-like enzyme